MTELTAVCRCGAVGMPIVLPGQHLVTLECGVCGRRTTMTGRTVITLEAIANAWNSEMALQSQVQVPPVFEDQIERHLDSLHEVWRLLHDARPFLRKMLASYKKCLNDGGTIFFAGNGGSAADAQHAAAELVNGMGAGNAGHRAVALTTDTSVLTAIGNDRGFNEVFAQQVRALGRAGDLLVLHSISGNSGNLIAAAYAARAREMTIIALTGRPGSALHQLADLAFATPARVDGQAAQTCHQVIQHLVIGAVQKARR